MEILQCMSDGFSDMIERLIEEQEQQLCTAVGVMNSTNSTTTTVISNELKINSSISFVPTMKRSFDQVDQDSEQPSSSSSKKSSLNTNNSPTTSTTIV